MGSVSIAGLPPWVNPYSWLSGALGLSSSPRRGLGAPFFVATLGPLIGCGLPSGAEGEEPPRLKLTSPDGSGGKARCGQWPSPR